MIDFPGPILGFAAWSGTGKTTLLSQIIPLLKSRGLRVALVKHAHHSFDIDHPGKDSHILRKAGANEVVIASRHRIASVRETPGNQEEPRLIDILSIMKIDQLDLILVEGFKMEDIPKVELHRKSLNKPYLYPDDMNIIALAEDSDIKVDRPGIESLDLGQPGEIAEFVEHFMKKHPGPGTVSRIDGGPRLCSAKH
jgi:molybdopterin-guanine dinucleotide biosynthesis protein MobB